MCTYVVEHAGGSLLCGNRGGVDDDVAALHMREGGPVEAKPRKVSILDLQERAKRERNELGETDVGDDVGLESRLDVLHL